MLELLPQGKRCVLVPYPSLRRWASRMSFSSLPNLHQISISTATKKNVPMYNLAIEITPKNSTKAQTIKVSRPFNEWFDAAGRFVAVPFQTMLATSVPAIGQLDTKRVAPPPEAADQKYSAEMLDMLASSTSDAQDASTTGSVSAKKGGKRRKA